MSLYQDHLISARPPLLSSRRLAALLILTTAALQTAMPAQEISRRVLPKPEGTVATVPLYAPFEVQLSTTRQYDNPYLDVNVTGVFISPTGKELRLAGFWDGGQTWRVRFTPDERGIWNYRTESADGELRVSNSFEALPSTRHGFVCVSKARPYQFEYCDGTPFLLMGDTNWDGMTAGVGLQARFKPYINLRASQGFNAYHAMVINNRYDYGTNEGGAPFDRFNSDTRNYNRVNPKYFQWVDRRVAYADSAGMVSILFFAWSEEVSKMSAEQYQRFVLYVVSRCAAYNVFWILAGDYQAYFYNPPLYRQVGEAVALADPFDHPISIHPADGYVNREFAQEPWLSYVMHQLRDAGEFLADTIRVDRVYNKPVVNGEYGYHVPESRHPYHGILQNADYTRTGGWSIFTAGGFFVAGFKHTFYDPDGHYPYDPGFDLPPVYWDLQNAKDLEAARQYGVFAKFFHEQIVWPDLQPHRELVRDGQTELLAKPGEEYVAYNTRGGRMRLQLPERQYFSLAWFDPIRGVLAPSRIFESTGETVLIMPADTLDAAALLRATTAPTIINAGRILGWRREQLNIRQVRYRWSTPEPADSRIDLQKPDGTRVQFLDNKLVTEHALVIDGLSPETDYAVVVSSQTNDRREWRVPTQTLRTAVAVMDEWIEAESVPTRTVGRGERPGWNLDNDGYLSVSLNFPQNGPYRFEIRARGEYRQSWPRLSLRLDETELADFTINSAVYKDFIFQGEIAAGKHELKIAFTNAGEERQLIVDRLHVQFARESASETEPESPPAALALRHFPNPFRELTLFTVDLPANGRIALKIFDLQGREVATIIEGERTAGQHDFAWNGVNAAQQAVAAGAYFAVLRYETATNGRSLVQVQKQKLLYLK